MSRTERVTLVFLAAILLCGTSSWAQRNLRDIPDPDPELERKSFIVADGFEVNLFAGDPQIAKPIQMNFDSEGRLWIASSEVYPHIKPGQKATDKILVLEDTDDDGQVDKTTVFADGLLIPTGVVPGDGGVYVANSTELIFLKDTDDDGKADYRRVVLSGFGTEDTHHLLHTLRWGHDGCLYMNQSIYIHSHIETPYGVKHLNGGGIWRFRPETMELDVLCRGFVNPWGHHFDHWGQSFATDGAYGEGINYVFPGAVYVTAVGLKRRLVGLNPGSPKHCGLEIVGGSHLPDDWQGNMITNDFRAHRVCRFVVTEDGSGYASRQETELIKTKHVAFRPIDVKMGSDGAIYIADWYNPIIQHGEVDFRDPRRDHVHGRIWRVTAKDRPLVDAPKIAGAPIGELLKLLKSPAEWQRLHAKLELKSRNHQSALAALRKWTAGLDSSDPDYEHHRLEALWTHQNLGNVEEGLLSELLNSDDHRVRAAAVRVVSHWQDELESPLRYMRVAVADKHPRVRLEAVRALSKVATARAAELALRVLDQPMDRFLDFALWQVMQDLEPYWLSAVSDGRLDFGGNVEHLTYALKAVESPGVVQPLLKLVEENKVAPDRADGVLTIIASLGGPAELGKVLATVFDADRPADRRASLLNALVEQTRQRKVRPSGDLSGIQELLDEDNVRLRAAAARAGGAWKIESMRRTLEMWTSPRLEIENELALAAVDALALLGGEETKQQLVMLAEVGKFDVRKRAIERLVVIDTAVAANRAVAFLQQAPDEESPETVIAALLARNEGPQALLAALGEHKLKPDIAKLSIRTVQASTRASDELIERLRSAGGLAEAVWKLDPKLLAELVEEVKTGGDPNRGEAVYRRQDMSCLKCHAIGGAGGVVGPDLVSIGASAQVDYLIESLIEPNKKVKENFHSKTVLDFDGNIHSGIVVRRGGGVLELRDAEDKLVRISLDNIDVEKDGRSLMPDGLVDPLTRGELVDLARFLSDLGKVGDFAVSKQRLVRRWQTLTWTQEAHRRLNRTSLDSAATNDPAFTWQSAYSTVAGQLPIAGLAKFVPHREQAPTAVVRFHLEATTPGSVKLGFGETTGLNSWLDGKPIAIEPELEVELERGTHSITLAIDTDRRKTPLRVELLDSNGSPAQAQLVGGK